MKKTLMVILFAVIAVGLTAPAFAVHPSTPAESVPLIGKSTIEVGGSLRFRGDYRNNSISLQTGAVQSNKADYDGRVRIHLNAYVTDNTMGRIHLQTGEHNGTDGYDWGCNTDEARDGSGTYGESNCMKDELRVLEAWIKSDNLFGSPLGLKVGHMPTKLGRGLFLNHTRFGDDVLDFFLPLGDNMQFDLVMSKFREDGARAASDDATMYSLIFDYNGDAFGIDADLTYVDDKVTNTFDQDMAAAADNIDDRAQRIKLWNLGVRADGDVGPVMLYGDVEFQFGSNEDSVDTNGDFVTDTDSDFGGWAGLIGADFMLGTVTLNAEFAYGSGDDNPDDNDTDMFQNTLSGIRKYTYVYEYRLAAASGSAGTGLANTTYFKIGADFKLLGGDLSIAPDLFFLTASEDVTLLDGTTKEDEIGFELDIMGSYKIDKNLSYFFEFGYLFAGDLYDKTADLAGTSNDWDDPYVFRHGVQLAF
jgi:hypothetical protein